MRTNTYRSIPVIEPISVTLDPTDGSINLQDCNGDEMAAILTISATTWRIIVREVARAKRDAALARLESSIHRTPPCSQTSPPAS
jgi:hypothetical protein